MVPASLSMYHSLYLLSLKQRSLKQRMTSRGLTRYASLRPPTYTPLMHELIQFRIKTPKE